MNGRRSSRVEVQPRSRGCEDASFIGTLNFPTLAAMQLMRSLSSRFASMSVKVEEFRIRKHGANEFAEYKITVWEGSSQYSVWRRWSDLKEAYEALEQEHAKEMKKKQIPAFEAHSMRLGAAHLDPEYLAKRQKTMERRPRCAACSRGRRR